MLRCFKEEHLFLDLLVFVDFLDDFNCLGHIFSVLSYVVQPQLWVALEEKQAGGGITYLLPKSESPFKQCFEVTLAQDLEIVAICFNVRSGDFQRIPSEEA